MRESRNILGLDALVYPLDYVYAGFVEEPHGHGYEEESKYIGGRGDDGCQNQEEDYHVAAIVFHHLGIDDSHLAHNPAEDGDFEYDAHGEAHHDEGVDVRLDGDGIFYYVTDLVGAQKSEGEGEDEKVSEQYAHQEHDVAPTY